MAGDAVTVFFSYSHKDEALRDELANHLKILKLEGVITDWHDRQILPGDEWDREIKESLNSAQIILLLISSDFIASQYCWDIEIKRAMERHEAGEACVIPVILRSCMWSSAPFGRLQALPKNAAPVTSTKDWPTKDEAFTNVAEGIKKTANDIQQKLKAERQGKLNQYETVYRQAIQQTYPLNEAVQSKLNRLQAALGLADADIAPIVTRLSGQYGEARQKLEKYRHEVRLCLEDDNGELSGLSRSILAGYRSSFGLTIEEATAVEQEELQPYKAKAEAVAQYEKVFADTLQHENPLSEGTRRRLQRFQQTLGLRDDEVEAIEALLVKKFDVITVSLQGKETYRERRSAHFFTEDLGGGVALTMVSIPAGEFLMGTADAERDTIIREYTRHGVSQEDAEEWTGPEMPQHRVKVPAFCMGQYPVTQEQWSRVAALPKVDRDLKADPSSFKGAKRPVERVSWEEAVEFCQRLSRQTGKLYRLPSEAEWEYACRAGTTTPFYFGPTITAEWVNCDGNYLYGEAPKSEYRAHTTEVGSFLPNGFGLYDMHGNVWEWCQDPWHENYQDAPVNGSVWTANANNDYRVLRGGSWFYIPVYCRSAQRYRYAPGDHITFVGFRVVFVSA
jgi:formylglycine-generating enzyme required for sulfatase activity